MFKLTKDLLKKIQVRCNECNASSAKCFNTAIMLGENEHTIEVSASFLVPVCDKFEGHINELFTVYTQLDVSVFDYYSDDELITNSVTELITGLELKLTNVLHEEGKLCLH